MLRLTSRSRLKSETYRDYPELSWDMQQMEVVREEGGFEVVGVRRSRRDSSCGKKLEHKYI